MSIAARGPGPAGRTTGPFAVKPAGGMIAEAGHGEGEGTLKRAVGALDLTALGVGAVIGTGIFVVIGEGIGMAGPAVILSFALAAITCVFSALCYAELASSIPVSGSAYTYAYATLGELIAWIIGWDLILEYGVSVAAVAVGWGGNLNEFLDNTFGFALPDSIATSPEDGGVFNLPAVAIVLGVTFILIRGVRETARTNLIMVAIKLAVLTFFVVVIFAAAFNADHMTPFAPEGTSGVVDAAAIIFFAYIGFDAVSTGAEEARNPRKDLPLAIVGSLLFCTAIYILVSVAAVGSLDAKALQASDAPLAEALDAGAGISWASSIVSFGALVAITSVLLTVFYGQTRIFFAMGRHHSRLQQANRAAAETP
jgi:basic amino acid/polyamine antiporter, APA family